MAEKKTLEEELHNNINGHEVILSEGQSFDKNKCNSVVSFADAAALCQYTYASNPLYPFGHVIYKSKTGSWFPYEVDDSSHSKWTKFRNGVSGMLGNGAFLGYSGNENDDLTSTIGQQKNIETNLNYSSFDFFGLLGSRIESKSMDADELFSVLKGRLKRTRTGFRSMIFYKKNAAGNKIDKIVYVTEGSKGGMNVFGGGIRGMADWFGDWILSNASQGVSGLSPQHTLSIQNAKILDKICASKNIELCFVGHSLGGGLATSNAIATNRPAVVFDMAGIHGFRRLRYNKIHSMELGKELINFYIKGEFLSVKGYEIVGPNHIKQSVEIDYKGSEKYSPFVLHNFIFFCKYFELERMEGNYNVKEYGL